MIMSKFKDVIADLIDICDKNSIFIDIDKYGIKLIYIKENWHFSRMYSAEMLNSLSITINELVDRFLEEARYKM